MQENWQVIDQVIAQNMAALRQPGVVAIRPGYQRVNGKVSTTPAIVVTVEPGSKPALPQTIGGYPVEARDASAMQLLRHQDPAGFSAQQSQQRPENRLPTHPYERNAEGKLISSTPVKKEKLPYQPPKNASLAPVTDTFDLIACVGPDAGWPCLKAFFSGTTQSLTVGMYDFTSPHVLAGLTAGLSKGKKMSLVLDHPPPQPYREQTNEKAVAALQQELGQGLAFAWAAQSHDPYVSASYFPSAYHIKVAVRDSSAMWLSSGNWNDSNQADIDPIKDPATANTIAAKSDRDWHLILAHKGLAQTFETYLLNDRAEAAKVQKTGQSAKPPTTPAAAATAETATHHLQTKGLQRQFFPAKHFRGVKATIHPVLTPDQGEGNYLARFLELINGAKRTLYIQMPYVLLETQDFSDPPSPILQLLKAVAAQMQAKVDVRVIFDGTYLHDGMLEHLQALGFDLTKVRKQMHLHNKGFIADSERVAIGSQNWSGDGVALNRDASVIIDSPEVSAYYEQVWLYDWEHLAKPMN